MHSMGIWPKKQLLPGGLGRWRLEEWTYRGMNTTGLQLLSRVGSHSYSRDAKIIRDKLCDYFSTAGFEHVSKTSDSFDER